MCAREKLKQPRERTQQGTSKQSNAEVLLPSVSISGALSHCHIEQRADHGAVFSQEAECSHSCRLEPCIKLIEKVTLLTTAGLSSEQHFACFDLKAISSTKLDLPTHSLLNDLLYTHN